MLRSGEGGMRCNRRDFEMRVPKAAHPRRPIVSFGVCGVFLSLRIKRLTTNSTTAERRRTRSGELARSRGARVVSSL